ncbi:MAG: hypothetical protein Q8O56_13935 [Solirubrobacteraceae bacterium]|nr:hypothetical protein [Solirubrobacteraceae bacterium]
MADREALVLDGLELNDGTVFSLDKVDLTPPAELEEWVKGADSHGAILAREPLAENRVITAELQVEPQATMDLALHWVGELADRLKECQRNRNGLPLTWVPAGSTLSPITFRCLSGQITGLPIDVTSGWLASAPSITVKLTCLPFGEGTETLFGSITSSAPLIALELASVGGDVDGRARLVVTDAAAQARRLVAWGLESRWLPTSDPPSLIVDSAAMVTSGYAGATATRAGAYGGATNNVISATLRTRPQAICSLGSLAHVGAFRPQLRFWASETTIAVRLRWQALDGPFRALSYKLPAVVGWNHVDLGLIDVPPTTMGAQRWVGVLEAHSTAVGGETFAVDAVWMMPAQRFGRTRGVYAYRPGVSQLIDDFDGRSPGATLGGTALQLGGSWATSGATPDFVAAAGAMRRTAWPDGGFPTGPRFAIAGAASYADTEASIDVRVDGHTNGPNQAVVVRWVNNQNYLILRNNDGQISLSLYIAGSFTNVHHPDGVIPGLVGSWFRLRLVAYSSGHAFGWVLTPSGGVLAELQISHSALRAGGPLASGRPGFMDWNVAGPLTRDYDNFYAGLPAPEPIVCHSGRSIEFRHDNALRADATGNVAGPPPEYVGSRFFVPPAGGPDRNTRVAVIARRNNVEAGADNDLVGNLTMDNTTVQAYVTPRYLVVPR